MEEMESPYLSDGEVRHIFKMGYDPIRFVGRVEDEFLCSICSNVFDGPVETPCGHLFCEDCINRWVMNSAECPVDHTQLAVSDLKKPCRAFGKLLGKLELKCDFAPNGCEAIVGLNGLQNHRLNCKFQPNAEIECGKGCNRTIRRHEQEAHNCLAHLSSLLLCQEQEIRRLQDLESLNSVTRDKNIFLTGQIDIRSSHYEGTKVEIRGKFKVL